MNYEASGVTLLRTYVSILHPRRIFCLLDGKETPQHQPLTRQYLAINGPDMRACKFWGMRAQEQSFELNLGIDLPTHTCRGRLSGAEQRTLLDIPTHVTGRRVLMSMDGFGILPLLGFRMDLSRPRHTRRTREAFQNLGTAVQF
jgi:hypothetical protein